MAGGADRRGTGGTGGIGGTGGTGGIGDIGNRWDRWNMGEQGTGGTGETAVEEQWDMWCKDMGVTWGNVVQFKIKLIDCVNVVEDTNTRRIFCEKETQVSSAGAGY